MPKQTLESISKKKAHLTARLQLLTQKEVSQKRKVETRKKILAGAYILEKHEREGTMTAFVKELDAFLIRAHDRILFGLPNKEEVKGKKVNEKNDKDANGKQVKS